MNMGMPNISPVACSLKVKLCECNIPSQVATDILNDTFGNKLGEVYINGLVDSQNGAR